MAHEWLQRLSPGDQSLARAVVARGWLTPEALSALVAQAPGHGLLALLRPRLAPDQLALLGAPSTAGTVGGGAGPGGDARTVLHPTPGAGPEPSGPASSASGVGPAGLRPGARVGPYVVEKELARGGMGVVLVARHLTLGRRVALKVLQGQARPEVQERLRIEAAAAARLKHPNIVAVHEVGEQDGAPWLAMDLIDGEDLAARVARDGPLAPDEAARWMETVARAMGYAHQQAILHRDLKPHNVLIDRAGVPFIVDFGLAKDVAGEGQGITVTGTFLGTPAYMPPEQAAGELEAIDRRSDVYSLGATLYHLLIGRPPFDGATAMNIVTKVLSKEPPRLRALRPELEADLETVCLRCLEKDPAARYPTAGALADDLARYRAGDPILARPVGPLARLARRVRRNRLLSAGLALGVVVLVVGLALFSGALVLSSREAEEARKLADVQRGVADAQRGVADQATRRAEEAQARAVLGQRRAETSALLERAYRAVTDGQYVEAEALFDEAAASAREELAACAPAATPPAARAEAEAHARSAGRGAAQARQGRRPSATLLASPGRTQVACGGTSIAVWSGDGVRVWRAEALDEPPTHLPLASRRCNALAVSPDGRRAAATLLPGPSRDSVLVVWDLARAVELWRRPGPQSGQGLLTFLQDGRLAVAAGDQKEVHVLEASSGAIGQRLARSEDGAPSDPDPTSLALMPGGGFAVGYGDGLLVGYPARSGLNLGRAAHALETLLLPDGQVRAVVGDREGRVDLYRRDRDFRPLLDGEMGRLVALDARVLGTEGRILAATANGAISTWDDDGDLVGALRLPAGEVFGGAISGLHRVVVALPGRAEVWASSPVRWVDGEGPLAFGRASATFAVAATRSDHEDRMQQLHSRRVSQYDAARPGVARSTIELPLFPRAAVSPVDVLGLAYAADDRELVLLVCDRQASECFVERREAASGRLLVSGPRFSAAYATLDLDPRAGRLLIGHRRFTAPVLEVRPLEDPGTVERSSTGWHRDPLAALRWLPGGRFLSVGTGGELGVWGLTGDRPELAVRLVAGEPLEGAEAGSADQERRDREGLVCAAASSDGETVLVGCADGALRIVSTRDLTCLATLRGHAAKVVGCAFLPDGRLVSVCRAGNLVVWDPDAGRVLRSVSGARATGLSVSHDGRFVAVWSAPSCWMIDVSVGE